MLPRIRSRAKKAIKLIERSVSSSKHSLKQTNETPGYARSRDKVELPADAGATPAAVPKPPPPKPVIVIDEANMLMKWKEPGPAEPQLESLLAFLVAMSKQNNLVHVYLATSNYFLANWLAEKGLAEGNFEIEKAFLTARDLSNNQGVDGDFPAAGGPDLQTELKRKAVSVVIQIHDTIQSEFFRASELHETELNTEVMLRRISVISRW
ncbi:hypothetical protein Ndes2437A_g05135 [Nannochloris sp. 'desiccata']